MTQHPTPEPVTGGIDIEKEAERFALSLLNHPSKFTAESIKSITEAFVGSLCDRVRQEEREKVLNEIKKLMQHSGTTHSSEKPYEWKTYEIKDFELASLRTKPVPVKEKE